ncbi:uncharacterized protein C19orf47-like isoform X2 [Lineus longissimus]|uniref:uncharacterized protein C19orf47-like isoform X2 n=1 Tax=Lineus longissimus TaxID=88925 RepID=UPI002B4C41E3
MAASASGNVTSNWIKFFTAASIPPSDAANYAIIFTDNRIQKDMLLDLNKEYLNDMGIAVMGDIIAILKHAKAVHSQEAREKALKETVSASTPSVTPSPRRSTPASRIVDHYLGNDPNAAPMNEPPPGPKLSKEMASRLGPAPAGGGGSGRSTPTLSKSALQAKKLGEGKYKVSMPKGTTTKTRKILEDKALVEVPDVSKSSVFTRLGDDSGETKFMVTGLASSSTSSGSSSVFNRLGGKTVKRAATSTSPDSDEDDTYRESALEYAGVLKSPIKKQKVQRQLPPKKAITITKNMPTRTIPQAVKKTVTIKVPEPRVPVPTEGIFHRDGVRTEGIFGRDGEVTKVSILKRLGKDLQVASASSTTPSVRSSAKAAVKTAAAKSSMKARLGPSPMEVSTSEKPSKKTAGGSVFSRLGSRD